MAGFVISPPAIAGNAEFKISVNYIDPYQLWE